MTFSPLGAAAAVVGHHPPPQQPPPSNYFTHTIGTGILHDRFNEVVVQMDFEDTPRSSLALQLLSTPCLISPVSPHAHQEVQWNRRQDPPSLRAGSLSPAISLTLDVPTGNDLLSYTGTAPAAINSPVAITATLSPGGSTFVQNLTPDFVKESKEEVFGKFVCIVNGETALYHGLPDAPQYKVVYAFCKDRGL